MPLDAPFFPALWALAIETATRPEVYLAVWLAESGLDPSAENAIGCIGLNQSCPKEHGGPGFPNDDGAAYKALPASAQLAWIRPQVLAQVAHNGGPFRSAARAWQANFLPATLATTKASGDVIAAAAGPYPQAYAANRQVDVNGSGAITLYDVGLWLDRAIRARGAALSDAIGQTYAARPEGAPWAGPRLVLFEPSAVDWRKVALVGGLLGVLFAASSHRGAVA